MDEERGWRNKSALTSHLCVANCPNFSLPQHSLHFCVVQQVHSWAYVRREMIRMDSLHNSLQTCLVETGFAAHQGPNSILEEVWRYMGLLD